MPREIKNPLKSQMTAAILNRILTIDEPYQANVAKSLNKRSSTINDQIETMVNRGWLSKEGEEGERKRNLILNTKEILRDTLIYSQLEVNYVDKFRGTETEELFCDLLESEIENCLQNIQFDVKIPRYDETRDFEGDWDKRVQKGGIRALIESIYQQIMAVESTIRLIDADVDTGFQVEDSKTRRNVEKYIEFLKAK
jgi:hypothetical protein